MFKIKSQWICETSFHLFQTIYFKRVIRFEKNDKNNSTIIKFRSCVPDCMFVIELRKTYSTDLTEISLEAGWYT